MFHKVLFSKIVPFMR